MYAQTFLLSLAARGYAGVPQAVLSYFAQTVRRLLNVPEGFRLLYGISFGIPDKTHPSLSYREGRGISGRKCRLASITTFYFLAERSVPSGRWLL